MCNIKPGTLFKVKKDYCYFFTIANNIETKVISVGVGEFFLIIEDKQSYAEVLYHNHLYTTGIDEFELENHLEIINLK